jgi:hypothetical protein
MPTSGPRIAILIVAIVGAVLVGVWLSGYGNCC